MLKYKQKCSECGKKITKYKLRIDNVPYCISCFDKTYAIVLPVNDNSRQIQWTKIEPGCEMPDKFDSLIIYIPKHNDYFKACYDSEAEFPFHTSGGWQHEIFTLEDVSHYAIVNNPTDDI